MNGKQRIILSFCVCLLLLILAGIYSYSSTRKFAQASKWGDHSQELISDVESIYTSVREMEAAVRGYVITGEGHYLGPFDRAVANGREACNLSLQLVKDQPEQRRLLELIKEELDQKIAFSESVVKERTQLGFETAQQLVLTRRGEKILLEMHLHINQFTEAEKKRMDERMAEEQHRLSEVFLIVITVVILSVLILLVTLYFFVKDYNKRIQSEELVRESEQRFRKILQTIPVGVIVLTADGKIYFLNEDAGRILGVEDWQKLQGSFLENNRLYEVGRTQPLAAGEVPLSKALRGEPTIASENLEIISNGERLRLRVNAFPLYNPQGYIDFAIAMFDDISELKKAESELLAAKMLAEESLILKETFLANMSHEIRTPMNAILGFTDLLLEEPIREKERDYVRTIRSAGESLLRIINDILDLSKIEANMMEFESQPLSVQDTLNSLRTMMLPKAREKQLDLIFSCDPRLVRSVLGDPTRLTQIIINLVGNAIKFTRRGSVAVSAQVTDEDTDAITVKFTVTDTGIGIAADKLDTIFQRFRQAESNTSRSYGGTGLGLSIARQLVELQGGQMEISSEVGKGSVFAFTLTFEKSHQAEEQLRKKENKEIDYDKIRQLQILLAEDNPINVKLIRNIFDQHAIRIDVAENGREVISLFNRKNYDLILMDMEMPELNGYETTRIIRKELESDVVIFAMTAHAMAGEKERCIQMGMNDFISKPLNARELFEKIYQLAEQLNKPPGESVISTFRHTHQEEVQVIPEAGQMDFSYLYELSGGNEAFEIEMLTLFLKQIPEELTELQTAYSVKDFKSVKIIAHRMKSSIPIIGANYLTAFLVILEESGVRESFNPESDEAMEQLRLHLEACFKEIEALIHSKENPQHISNE